MIQTLITNRYRIEEEIASGGMATVYKATDEVLSRPVALKIIHEHLASDDVFAERFRREAMSSAALSHPCIVSVFDTGEHEGRPFIVMEHLDGGTLKTRLSEAGRLDPERVASIGASVASALATAHAAGIVHRDIKPANILFSEKGLVKVADFGIAKAAMAASDLTATGAILGTVRYIAPEVLEGKEPEGAADLFSLGIVLYEAVTGKIPFDGETTMAAAIARFEKKPPAPRDLRTDVPRDLEAVIMRMMARDPGERLKDASEAASLLGAIAEPTVASMRSVPPQPRRAPAAPPPAEPRDDRTISFVKSEGRWLAPIVVVALVAVALVAAVLKWGGRVGIDLPNPLNRGGDTEALQITGAGVFDPRGDGREKDELVPLVHDGDASTSWRTQSYKTRNFGGLKDGVGIWVDLGKPARLKALDVVSVEGGWQGSIRHSDDGRAWSQPGEVKNAGTETRFEATGSHRYWMVWITGLVNTPGQGSESNPFSVGIAEIRPVR